MSLPFEEMLSGQRLLRPPPGRRHEKICDRLHALVAAALAPLTTTRRLEPRAQVELGMGTIVRPDLALVTVATSKLWLVAEVISSEDHHVDTVLKKALYEEMNLPRLWMVDPRYDNVEIYHGSPYGLALKGILAGREVLGEVLMPTLQVTIKELFQE